MIDGRASARIRRRTPMTKLCDPPNFTLSLKIFKTLCDLRDLCVSLFPLEEN